MPTGNEVRIIRHKQKLSQRQFAKRLAVSTVLIAMVETGQRQVTRQLLQRIADVFGHSFTIRIKPR